jgi:plasmid stabilization system protein ParE
MTTVLIVDEAEAQFREVAAWWVENREAAPDLLIGEFERCVTLLESSPDAGAGFHRTKIPGVRRLVMKRTKHFLYYVHDEPNAVLYIIPIWGAPKHGDPVLRDPR